ncbi:hypothetical protein LJC54_00170 [Parabacteroides sp. OttesenSCG-928-J18]|nr:hypothetical protein [Parabacteroides sp. OttesenSCG-928-J18]
MTIKNYQDLIYQLRLTNASGNVIRLDDVVELEAKFYTNNEAAACTCYYSQERTANITIQPDRDLANINAEDLTNLENGIIKYKYIYSVIDNDFEDGFFNSVLQGETNYFLAVPTNNNTDLSNYYTKQQTNVLLDNKADKNDVYTKAETYNRNEIDTKISEIVPPDVDLSNYYKKNETYNKVEVDTKLNEKANADIVDADIAELTTKINNTYTKTEVDEKIDNIDIPDVDLTNYYTKDETYSQQQTNGMMDFYVNAKLTNYYVKAETYTQLEIDNKLHAKMDWLNAGANIQIKDYTISATDTIYNDTEVRELINNETNNRITGDELKADKSQFITLTQAEYDLITPASNTYYFIKNA